MLAIVAKAALTALFIVAVSEIAKRSTFAAALLIALPLATVLTAIWLYIDTKDAGRVAQFAWSTFLLVPPGLVFFLALPLALKAGLAFWPALGISVAATGGVYFGYATLLQRFGVTL